jgi:ATP-dependent DNA ligase
MHLDWTTLIGPAVVAGVIDRLGFCQDAELERLWRRLQSLATPDMPLDVPPPRDSRFGSPLVLSRVHWVRPELVAEVKYLTWTDDNLLRQVVYEGLREDKPAAEVRRPAPYPKPPEPARPAPRSKRPRSG